MRKSNWKHFSELDEKQQTRARELFDMTERLEAEAGIAVIRKYPVTECSFDLDPDGQVNDHGFCGPL